MKLFYYIVVHKNPVQVARLVASINDGSCVICIHVDAKADINKFTNVVPKRDNVFFISEREKVFWSGFSQVKATLSGMKAFAGSGCDFFVFLSGQDFPIKPLSDFKDHLEKHKNNSFMDLRLVEEDWSGAIQRIKTKRDIDLYSNWRYRYKFLVPFINKLEALSIKMGSTTREVPFKYKLYGGSTWFTLNREAVEYILKMINEKPEFSEFFRTAVCPDEHFFHTIIANSPLSNSIINDNLRYLRFLPGKDSPEILTMNDLDAIQKSGAFFARKFDLEAQPYILNRLEHLIRK